MAEATSFQRSPVDRGYRISSLAKAVEALGRNVEEGLTADPLFARPGDGSTIAELAEAIHEEATALVDALDIAELAKRMANV